MRRGYMHPDGELTPMKIETLQRQGFPVQARWDFKEETTTDDDGNEQTMWSFNVETIAERWRNPQKTGLPYAKDKVVWLDGKVWLSLVDDNHNKPGHESWERIGGFTGIIEALVAVDEPPEWVQPQGTVGLYKLGDVVQRNQRKWLSNHPHNSWQPGTTHPALRIWIDLGPLAGIEPGDLCDTTPAWSAENAATYQAEAMAGNIVRVKHNGAIWKSKNASHLWIAPSITGNGAYSWEWEKDCTAEPPVEPPANPCDSIKIWTFNEGYTNMAEGDLRKREVDGIWKVYKVKTGGLGQVHQDPAGPYGYYAWEYQYDCPS